MKNRVQQVIQLIRHWRTHFVLALVVFSLVMVQPIMATSTQVASGVPWLHVQGNRIVDENDAPVLLSGVMLDEQCYDSIHPEVSYIHRFGEADMARLVQNWHVNVVRVPIMPGLWQRCPNYLETVLDPIVNWANKYGVYILLGWHAHGNPITGETDEIELCDAWSFHGCPEDPNMTLAENFWNAAAERYKNDPWVIYSIFNEPYNIAWSDWRPLAEQLVDVVRSHNPKALILVPGVSWAYDLRDVGQDPVQRANIVYEVHVYPGFLNFSRIPYDQRFGYLAPSYPLFMGEWGFEPGSSDPNLNGTAESFGKPIMAYMQQKSMSWTAFSWSSFWTPGMLDSALQPNDFGQFVESALDTLPSTSTSTTTSSSTTQASSSSTSSTSTSSSTTTSSAITTTITTTSNSTSYLVVKRRR